jgi:hypothetical protein
MLHAPLESTDLADVQQSFADAYPRIEGLASAQHCRLKGERKEEAVAETVGIAWSEYRKDMVKKNFLDPLLHHSLA